MARGGTVFISTNPQNNLPIGTPGQGVFIGHPGQLIYGRSPAAIAATSLELDLTNLDLDLTTLEIQAS